MPFSSQATASPSRITERERRPTTASTISGTREFQEQDAAGNPVWPERLWLTDADFWADEFDSARPLPTRIEDRLLRRAKALRATPDIAWVLSKIAGAETTDAQPIDRDASPPAER